MIAKKLPKRGENWMKLGELRKLAQATGALEEPGLYRTVQQEMQDRMRQMGFDPDAHLLTRTLEITYSANIYSTPSHACLQEAFILAENIQVHK
jgi:hypothetical protein